MQLFSVVWQELTAPMAWPTCAGTTVWTWVTAQDSRSLFAQVVRSVTSSAALMHFTLSRRR